MESWVDVAARADLDELSDVEVEDILDRLRRPITQLEGLRARAAAAAQRRRISARPDLPTVQVIGEHRKELGQQQRMAPGEVDRALEAGRAAELGDRTDQAIRDGQLGSSHARTIARILSTLLGDQRAAAEAELVELAKTLDPIAFGRAARRLQGRLQPEILARTERQQEFQRRFRATDTDDGGFAFSGLLYGTAAETARVALQAFRRPDTPDEHRTPEQRGADAFEQLCAASLTAGDAPTQHGVRPQVMVLIDAADLAGLEDAPDQVVGRFVASGQPVTGRALRHLVHDSQLLRLVVDAEGVPIEVSTKVRTVPAGLWRALLVRDGGCVWPGCDAPASWCDVAHGRDAYAADGKLSLGNAMLLCRRHHRRFDAGTRRVRIDGAKVSFPGLDNIRPGGEGSAHGREPPGRRSDAAGARPERDAARSRAGSRPDPGRGDPPTRRSGPGTTRDGPVTAPSARASADAAPPRQASARSGRGRGQRGSRQRGPRQRAGQLSLEGDGGP